MPLNQTLCCLNQVRQNILICQTEALSYFIAGHDRAWEKTKVLHYNLDKGILKMGMILEEKRAISM